MEYPLSFLAAALALGTLGGCATPTPADRIAAHQAEFASWPPQVQANVRAGIVAAGYTPEQVLVALGPPNMKSAAAGPGDVAEVWVYERRAPRLSVGFGVGSFGRSSAVGGDVGVNGIKLGQDVGGRVIFRNGRVVDVEIMTR